jgi:hypothetical protein
MPRPPSTQPALGSLIRRAQRRAGSTTASVRSSSDSITASARVRSPGSGDWAAATAGGTALVLCSAEAKSASSKGC